MHFTPQGPGPRRFIGSFLAVLALIGPINSVLAFSASAAAPHNKRALDFPGLGVELEIAQIIYDPKGKKYEDMTSDRREQLKGAIITPIAFGKDHAKENWDITAEISGTDKPYTEIISDGKKNEIGKHGTRKVGEQITTYMGDWAPCRDKDCKVQIDGFAEYNPWAVLWPKGETKFEKLRISPQATAAMPLEGLLQVLKDGKDKKDNVLANQLASYNDKIVIPTKDSFKDFGKINPDDITDEFLGFFSLLTTYCIVANDNDEIYGPKRSLNIMPRTDFLAMYKKFIEEKLKAEISDCGNSLYTIVSTVSGVANNKLKDYEFKWKPDDLRNKIDQDWDGKDDMIKKGRLRVDKFLDDLQMDDKVAKKQLDLLKLMDLSTRHGQIGGLNDRMESVVDHPSSPAPIFEFRDLKATTGDDVATRMGEYEDKAIEMHKKAIVAPLVARVGNELKCKPKTTECPTGQVPDAATGKCMDVGPVAPYNTGTCCFHLEETQIPCLSDDKNLLAYVKMVDDKKLPIGETQVSNGETGVHIDNGNSYSFKSKLLNPLVITGEHQNDYVQFTIGGLSWQSTTPNGGASCTVGGWDPRQGPSCRRYGTKLAKNNMDCCFPCDGKT